MNDVGERAASDPAGDALRAAIAGVVARSRLPVDERAMALLAALVDAGCERVARDDPLGSRGDEAVAAFRSLFDDMTQQSRILRFDAIHAPNVVDALERLCPRWPFCD